MGLLDDLKRQAEARQAQLQSSGASLERQTALVEGACTTAFRYWMELAKQLNVLKPVAPARYALDGRHVFEQLPMSDFRVDARRRSPAPNAPHEHVQLFWLLGSGRPLVITKDYPNEIEKLQTRLRMSGVDFHIENIRDPEDGRYLHTRFEFTADFTAGVKLLPQHEQGQVQFQLINLEGFETALVELPAFEVNQAVLDELAKLMLGQPNGFFQCGRVLRRG
ncbi:hypothetical protein [Caldimonas brevitalea]|uniref:hypothetical protein n=1 Tax=Caldimonas brevitalea TaxID=413882 RepID=UPI0012FBF131|nr:hypothetical protein [Caldimonas brevitalea]